MCRCSRAFEQFVRLPGATDSGSLSCRRERLGRNTLMVKRQLPRATTLGIELLEGICQPVCDHIKQLQLVRMLSYD